MSRLLTPREAVTHLSLPSVSALYWHIQQNKLPYRRVGRQYRFTVADLDQWTTRGMDAPILRVVRHGVSA